MVIKVKSLRKILIIQLNINFNMEKQLLKLLEEKEFKPLFQYDDKLTQKENQLAFLEFFKGYFNINNRALLKGHISEDRCTYLNEEGKRCGVGILFNNEQLKILVEKDAMSQSVLWLPKEVTVPPLNGNFLAKIQLIHDNLLNFDEFGLTERGEFKYNELKEQVENGVYS
jgi:hypothetical protein